MAAAGPVPLDFRSAGTHGNPPGHFRLLPHYNDTSRRCSPGCDQSPGLPVDRVLAAVGWAGEGAPGRKRAAAVHLHDGADLGAALIPAACHVGSQPAMLAWDCPKSQRSNLGRHDVQARQEIVDGRVPTKMCSCGLDALSLPTQTRRCSLCGWPGHCSGRCPTSASVGLPAASIEKPARQHAVAPLPA